MTEENRLTERRKGRSAALGAQFMAMMAMRDPYGWSIGNDFGSAPRAYGKPIGGKAEDGKPFQDSNGKWYVRHKGTIRRSEAPVEP